MSRNRTAVFTAAIVAVAACALVLAFAAFGGDEPPTLAAFAGEANAVCTEYERKFDALPEPQSLAEVAKIAPTAVGLVSEYVAELRALDVPTDSRADVELWLDQQDARLAALRGVAAAAERRDEKAVEAALERFWSDGDDALAARLGLDACES